jgi:acyl-CoA reductase-like NAD-dependent aldehyde dehydrogenase
VSAITFDDVDDMVRQSNRSIYGLAAAVWTRDIKKAHRLARDLKAGTIWINTYNSFDAASPLAGLSKVVLVESWGFMHWSYIHR